MSIGNIKISSANGKIPEYTWTQRNLDITKGQGTGQICSLKWGSVVSRFFFICNTITGVKKLILCRGLHYPEVHYIEVPLFLLYGKGGVRGFFFFWGVWHFSVEGFYPTPVSEPINLPLEIDNKQLPIKWECLLMKSTLCNAGHPLNQGTNSGPPSQVLF